MKWYFQCFSTWVFCIITFIIFFKLFLLQMDDITTNVVDQNVVNNKPVGCSSICLNEPNNVNELWLFWILKNFLFSNERRNFLQEILGHTEDALSEVLNHYYILSAHIISDKPMGKWKVMILSFEYEKHQLLHKNLFLLCLQWILIQNTHFFCYEFFTSHTQEFINKYL